MLDVTEKLLYYYENMVNWNKRLSLEGPFIVEQLKKYGAKNVLDCGCGIGRHTAYLSERGFEASGSDKNPLHIKRARELSTADFFLEDMLTLNQQEDSSRSAILCIGNTLSALGIDNVRKALATFGRVLKPGGLILGQVLNFTSFGEEDRSEVRYAVSNGIKRYYVKTFHPSEDYIDVIINVVDHGEDAPSVAVENTRMYRLYAGFLAESLSSAGFGEPSFYGSLSGSAFDPGTSRDLVFTAQKF